MRKTDRTSNKPSLHPTLNSLPAATRVKVVPLLARGLAEAGDLKLQAKQAHWNLKGPNFIALHELFDHVAAHADLFTEVSRAADKDLWFLESHLHAD